jgi:chromosome segregation ATPase
VLREARDRLATAESRATDLEARLEAASSSQGEALRTTEEQLAAKQQEAAQKDEQIRAIDEQLHAGREELEAALADLSARDAASSDGSERIAALEGELQEATRRAAELEATVTESKEALARAEEAARLAPERADALPSEHTPTSVAADDGRVPALHAEIRELEKRLEQTELRARHAYAEAENAQAELRFARDRGDAPVPADDGRLRAELAAALARVQAAEERSAALSAEVLLLKKGVDVSADDENDPTNGFAVDPDEEGVNLRARLSRAVESKRATGEDDTHQWR